MQTIQELLKPSESGCNKLCKFTVNVWCSREFKLRRTSTCQNQLQSFRNTCKVVLNALVKRFHCYSHLLIRMKHAYRSRLGIRVVPATYAVHFVQQYNSTTILTFTRLSKKRIKTQGPPEDWLWPSPSSSLSGDIANERSSMGAHETDAKWCTTELVQNGTHVGPPPRLTYWRKGDVVFHWPHSLV